MQTFQQKGLTNIQISVIITLSIIGLSVMFLPRLAAEYAGIDGALATFLGGIVSTIMAGVIILLSKRFPNQTVIEYSQEILGKFLGKAFGVMIILHSLTVTSYILRAFADAMKVLLLPRTPLELTMITMLLLTLYCVQGGISTIARTDEIFLIPIVLVIGTTILFNIPEIQFYRYRSSLSNGITPVLRGVAGTALAYTGYEILFFLLPFMKDKKKILQAGLSGLVLPILIYTGLVFVMIGVIDEKTTAELVYPTVHLARRIGIHFVERFDIFFIIFWILAVFTSLTTYLYMASISITRLLNFRNYKPFIFILAPFCYALAILPQNVTEISFLSKAINYSGLIILLSSLPLLVIAVLRKKGGTKSA